MDHGRRREAVGAVGRRFVLSVRGEKAQREVKREAELEGTRAVNKSGQGRKRRNAKKEAKCPRRGNCGTF